MSPRFSVKFSNVLIIMLIKNSGYKLIDQIVHEIHVIPEFRTDLSTVILKNEKLLDRIYYRQETRKKLDFVMFV